MLTSATTVICLEQTAERTRKAAAGSGQHAGSVEDTEEQRKVFIDLLVWFNRVIEH